MTFLSSNLTCWSKATMTCCSRVSCSKTAETTINPKLSGTRARLTKSTRWSQLARTKDSKRSQRLKSKWSSCKSIPRQISTRNTKLLVKSYLPKTVLVKFMDSLEDLHKKDLDLRWPSVKKLRKESTRFWKSFKSSVTRLRVASLLRTTTTPKRDRASASKSE